MKHMLIPRSCIPKVLAMCVVCESAKVATRVSMPFADGYYRRHQCRECGTVFHSLAPYDGSLAEVSMSPFKDRELSEYEAYQRLQYWKKDAERDNITLKVTMLSRIGLALSKPKEVRSDVENYIVAVYHALEKKVHEMETPAEEGSTS